MSKNAPLPVKSNFSIVRKIAALLNLGEEGKLDSFFNKVVKSLSNEIKVKKNNLNSKKLLHEQKLDELEDKLEDAKLALEESFLKVDVSNITTNEDQTNYVDKYLDNIDVKYLQVKKLEDQIEKEKEAYAQDCKTTEEDVDSLTLRIQIIKEEK